VLGPAGSKEAPFSIEPNVLADARAGKRTVYIRVQVTYETTDGSIGETTEGLRYEQFEDSFSFSHYGQHSKAT
jgi:hypothetical protein